MPPTFSHDQFVSPFAWRYGSDRMRAIWSEVEKRRLWRRIWLALARAQAQAGIVTSAQVKDLAAHVDDIDIDRALAIEARIHHDLMAEIQTYAAQCPVGGAIIHLGATSADIEDNADILRIRASLDLILDGLRALLIAFAGRIDELADVAVIGFTHLQPAEPTTMGYRLALYAQDVYEDYRSLTTIRDRLCGKGLKGAVGTSASFAELLQDTPFTPEQFEALVMADLDLPPYPITSQVYPRKQDWRVLSALAGLAATLHRFAFDLRLLQSPVIGEWFEPFAEHQVGSSAMPFKRNPIQAEKIDSLSRLVRAQADVAWDNASLSLLERTLDDSASRREILPVAFLATDELLSTAHRLIAGLRVDREAAARNLQRFGLFAAVERVLMAAVKAGADRQHMHEHLRAHSLAAWTEVAAGHPNPLPDRLASSAELLAYLSPDTIRALLDVSHYVGDAPERARRFAMQLKTLLVSS